MVHPVGRDSAGTGPYPSSGCIYPAFFALRKPRAEAGLDGISTVCHKSNVLRVHFIQPLIKRLEAPAADRRHGSPERRRAGVDPVHTGTIPHFPGPRPWPGSTPAAPSLTVPPYVTSAAADRIDRYSKRGDE
jgi:hypothetical protein